MADEKPFSTVFLRFRDLVTGPNETIGLHRQIIESAGAVWWGWWSKAGERVPDESFRWIRDRAIPAPGLQVFLVDSGTGRIYRATCRDLKWDISHERLPSPAASETPEYYTEQRYFAWYRFTAIEDAVEGDLTQFTYVRVDEFFDEGASRYSPFYEKRVHSVRELRQQDRTTWFVRAADVSDPTQEVSLLDARRLTPSHFSREFIYSPSRTLLWISDPHLESGDHHAFPLQSDKLSNKSLGHAIEDACKDVAKVEQLAGVLVSGDLTWMAKPSEFALARDLISRINTWAKLDNYQYAVCPGNHDVRFSDDPSSKDSPVAAASAKANEAYAAFYRDFFYLAPNEFLSCGRRYLLGGSVPVEIILLNSSLLQQGKDYFQGHGFVGDAQMRDAETAYNWSSVPTDRAVRILVVHHHLLPVTFREEPANGRLYSTALDAEAIMRWAVRARVDAVLHGHMHQPFYSKTTRSVELEGDTAEHTIAVVGAGSAGVAHPHLGEVRKNTFTTLTFGSHAIDVAVYTVSPSTPSARLWSAKVQLHRGGV